MKWWRHSGSILSWWKLIARNHGKIVSLKTRLKAWTTWINPWPPLSQTEHTVRRTVEFIIIEKLRQDGVLAFRPYACIAVLAIYMPPIRFCICVKMLYVYACHAILQTCCFFWSIQKLYVYACHAILQTCRFCWSIQKL